MMLDFAKLRKLISSKHSKFWIRVIFIVLLAYVLATIASAIGANFFLKTKQANKRRRTNTAMNTANLNKTMNYRDMRRVVLKRNIFNSTGEVPDFDEAPNLVTKPNQCNPPTLNIKIVGTIYMGDKNSIVTVREASYSHADTYKVNDMLIGHDNVQIVAIERKRMVIDNNGSRECYEIEQPKTSIASNYKPTKPTEKKKPLTQRDGNTVVLSSEWVEKELGPGFSKVIQSARLVPNTTDGDRVNGFKIFAIKSGTLFNKIGLRNGDIIQRVNDVSLEQVEQGFALYQTFQEDQEIVFNIVRKDNPQTISVMIK